MDSMADADVSLTDIEGSFDIEVDVIHEVLFRKGAIPKKTRLSRGLFTTAHVKEIGRAAASALIKSRADEVRLRGFWFRGDKGRRCWNPPWHDKERYERQKKRGIAK